MAQAADSGIPLFCTVPFEDRFNGYNGVRRLRYGDAPSSFAPCFAGQNCEFFFDHKHASYEPRWSGEFLKFKAQPSSLE